MSRRESIFVLIGDRLKIDELVEQVRREINLSKFIHHPNIVRMVDHYEAKDFLYICSEYFKANDLRAFCAY